MADAYDGHPIQAGARAGRLQGRHAAFSQIGFIEAVVVALRYAGDPGNRQQNSPEYDVRDLTTGSILTHVRALQSVSGLSNGDERVYHAASKTLSGATFSKMSAAADTDGDYVLVGFIAGARENAVILGALPHLRSIYGAKAADGVKGERRFLTQNGTTAIIAQDGTFSIARAGTVIAVDVDGVVTVVASDIQLGDPNTLRSCAGVGDTIHVPLLELVSKLTPFFVPTSAPPPPPELFVAGNITTGSAAVTVSK